MELEIRFIPHFFVEPNNFLHLQSMINYLCQVEINYKEVKTVQEEKDINGVDNLELGVNDYFKKISLEYNYKIIKVLYFFQILEYFFSYFYYEFRLKINSI
jgi:hypothetical protein